MIQINLPGSKNKFFLYDNSVGKAIEREVSSKFYPYTVSKNDDFTLDITSKNSIVFETNGYKLTICNSDYRIVEKCYSSISITYKKICSVIRENLIVQDGFCFLHGSAVLLNEKVCLFLAETNTGKSTFSVYSELFNHTCISDDLIILSIQDNRVYPISKNAHVRLGAEYFLPCQNALSYNSLIARYDYPLKTERFHKKYIVKYIFLLERTDSIFNIEALDDPLEGILSNMFLPYQIYNNVSSALIIKEQYQIFHICYRSPDELLQGVNSFIEMNSIN